MSHFNKVVVSGMIGQWQFLIEEGTHVHVYRVKYWHVGVGSRVDDTSIIYNQDLLGACNEVVKRLTKMPGNEGGIIMF